MNMDQTVEERILSDSDFNVKRLISWGLFVLNSEAGHFPSTSLHGLSE